MTGLSVSEPTWVLLRCFVLAPVAVGVSWLFFLLFERPFLTPTRSPGAQPFLRHRARGTGDLLGPGIALTGRARGGTVHHLARPLLARPVPGPCKPGFSRWTIDLCCPGYDPPATRPRLPRRSQIGCGRERIE